MIYLVDESRHEHERVAVKISNNRFYVVALCSALLLECAINNIAKTAPMISIQVYKLRPSGSTVKPVLSEYTECKFCRILRFLIGGVSKTASKLFG